jgi:DNA-directed RNA polymerase specialized sigma24 family protein
VAQERWNPRGDLIQGFFARLLEKNLLAAADPHKGRFRGFLMTALNRHLSGRWRSDGALKRSPYQTLPLDFEEADRRFRLEPKTEETPERIYERKWAATVLHEPASALRREYESRGRGEAFELLKGYLSGKDPGQSYRLPASRLETTEGMIAVMIHRLRQRYRRKIEEEIAQTIADPADITPEFEHLMRVCGGRKSDDIRPCSARVRAGMRRRFRVGFFDRGAGERTPPATRLCRAVCSLDVVDRVSEELTKYRLVHISQSLDVETGLSGLVFPKAAQKLPVPVEAGHDVKG